MAATAGRSARGAARAAAAGRPDGARGAGGDDGARRAAARDGQRAPGFLRLGQLPACARRCAGVADGRRDEPERGVGRSRRRSPRAHGRALAGGARRVPARAGRWAPDQRGIRGDDRLLGRCPRPRLRRRGPRRAPGRARARPAPRCLCALRGAQLRPARARAARARQRLHPAGAAARRASRRGRAARRDRGRPRGRRDACAARGLGGNREHRRDRPARHARRSSRPPSSSGSTSTGPTAPSACSIRRWPRATGAWRTPTR